PRCATGPPNDVSPRRVATASTSSAPPGRVSTTLASPFMVVSCLAGFYESFRDPVSDATRMQRGERGSKSGRPSLPGPIPAEQPGVVEGDLAQVVVGAGATAVSRVHVDLEERGLRATVEGAQLGDPLRGLPVHHLAVVQ